MVRETRKTPIAVSAIRYTEIRGEELEKAVNTLLKEAETKIAGESGPATASRP